MVQKTYDKNLTTSSHYDYLKSIMLEIKQKFGLIKHD